MIGFLDQIPAGAWIALLGIIVSVSAILIKGIDKKAGGNNNIKASCRNRFKNTYEKIGKNTNDISAIESDIRNIKDTQNKTFDLVKIILEKVE